MSGPGTDSDGGLGGLFSGVGNAVGNVGDTMTGLFGAPAAGPGTPSGGTRGEGLSHGPTELLPTPAEPTVQHPESPPSIADFVRNPDDFVEIPAFSPGLQEALARQISAAFGGDEQAYHDGLSKIYAPVSAPILDEPITQMNEERRRQLGLFGSAENA